MKMRKTILFVVLACVSVAFTACDDDDDYWYGHPEWADPGDDGGHDRPSESNSPLVAQWQGSIGNNYYAEVWGATGAEFATVCEFTADGEGAQLDYDISSPQSSFAYSPFTWTQSSGAITITYQSDGQLSAARISDFALTSASFTGTMAYGDGNYPFKYTYVEGFDWSPYIYYPQSDAKTRLDGLRLAGAGQVRCGAFAR